MNGPATPGCAPADAVTTRSSTLGSAARSSRWRSWARIASDGPVHDLSAQDVKDLKLAVRRLTRLWRQRSNLSPERAACRVRLVRILDVLDQCPDGCELRATEPGQAP